MKCLNLQLQPQKSPEVDIRGSVQHLVTTAKSLSSTVGVEIDEGDDASSHAGMNININSNDLSGLWPVVRSVILSDSSLASCSVACCEGEHGWEDYLLLFHFDEKQVLDAL
jgi:hypothetical protein